MKEKPFETINYRGFKIECYYDTDYESPNDWGDEEQFIVYDHRDFTITRKYFEPQEIFERMQNGFKLFPNDEFWFFPVYAYIHSGVSLSLSRRVYPFNDRWDVSFKGFALIKRQKGTWTEDNAYKAAQGLIETWNEYLSGEVYGYISETGSCWSYYGDEGLNQMIAEAKNEIDHHILLERKNHFSYLKKMIKNHVPLNIRNKCKYVN